MTETRLDPRLTPARPDLAAQHLQGRVEAARFVEGVTKVVAEAQAPMRRDPAPAAPLDTEALMGERVTVYESTDEGWAWAQLEQDGYVGWLPSNALADPGPAPTHKVAVLRTFEFPGPSIKLPPLHSPSLGARVTVIEQTGPLARLSSGGFMPARHLAPLVERESDFVAVAERFAGVPYLWGGKTSFGLDCSGLVQVALQACGVSCPRDSDMQERGLGAPLPEGADLTRGDLVFWQGHVAIARDAGSIIHANAFHMAVTIEPFTEAVARIRASGSEITSIRRL